MNKTQLINYQSELLSERDDTIDLLNAQLDMQAGLVEMLEKQADNDEGLHKRLMADEKARHAAEKKAAEEAATLKSIANGLIPVAELRALVSHHGVGIVVPGEEMPSVDLEWPVESTLVQRAILAALLVKPVKGGFMGRPGSPWRPDENGNLIRPPAEFGAQDTTGGHADSFEDWLSAVDRARLASVGVKLPTATRSAARAAYDKLATGTGRVSSEEYRAGAQPLFSPFKPGDKVRVSPANTSFGSGWFVRGVA